MTPPLWIIPLEPGQVTEDGPRIEVSVRSDLRIYVDDPRSPGGPYESVVACQLGQALQDASRWCGQERARRDANRAKRRRGATR
jgi:hypothetical protein